MGSPALRGLRSSWPLVGVLLTFLVGLAVAGFGWGVVGGMLSILVFGPAYLIQNSVRRRRGTLPPPPTETPEEKAQADARFLRFSAISSLAIAVVAISVVAVGRGNWLPGSGWTGVLLLGAAFGITSAPHTWAIAELRETKRSLRWAWALSALCDLLFGVAAATIAVTNQRSHWIGGSTWTVGLAAAALLWLLGAPGDVARVRR
jgi:hypothetical protein